jgi:prolyl-tRNA synthetase
MGKKSEKEKFAGAVESYSIEGLMPDGKALQMGTVHYLGDNFSKMADVSFLDADMSRKFVQMTSWGVSTRLIGALIMVHGDDKGLVLPPKIAPVQVVIVPIGETIDYAYSIKQELEKYDIRVELDLREDIRPGVKYYEHEVRGVPIRLEIGERELTSNTISYTIRHNLEKANIDYAVVGQSVSELLNKIQEDMLATASDKLKLRTLCAEEKNDFEQLLNKQAGFIRANWCGETSCESAIKESTSAVTRNMPLHEQHNIKGNCIWCGKKSKKIAYFAKAY